MRLYTITIFLISFSISLMAQYPKPGSEVVTNISNLPKGYIIIGSSGVGVDCRWTVIDGARYDKFDREHVCYSIDDAANWKKISYQESGCGNCSIAPPGGNATNACYIYEKLTPKTVGGGPPPPNQNQGSIVNQQNHETSGVIKPKEKFGTVGFYTDYVNGFGIYIYKVGSKAGKVKTYQTGYSKVLPAIFKMDEKNLVYSNKIDRYYIMGNVPNSFDAAGVVSMKLTEGTYQVIVYDDGFLMKSERIINITDGSSSLQPIKPTIQMGVPYSEMEPPGRTTNRNIKKASPQQSSGPFEDLPPPPDDLVLKEYYPFKSILKNSSQATKLYDYTDKDGPFDDAIEKIVKIRISNYDEFDKIPPVYVYAHQNSYNNRTEIKKLALTGREIIVKGFYVEIICLREKSNVKIDYKIVD